MPTPTYIALANTTLSTTATEVVFGSIPNTYRDLVIQGFGPTANNPNAKIYFNNDETDSNYRSITMYVEDSTRGTTANNDSRCLTLGITNFSFIINVFDYSATDKRKQVLSRSSSAAKMVRAFSVNWANTNAITTIKIRVDSPYSFSSGTTLSLYGIVS
jgi:hypothetical protein